MKKFLGLILVVFFFLVGCTNISNTPIGEVEEFLSKYQSLDKDVINQLDTIISDNDFMNKEQKDKYKKLMEKQYQNLSYKLNNEEIRGNNAIVDVEIEVLDYSNAILKIDKYYKEHKEEIEQDFKESNKQLEYKNEEELEKIIYIDYKLKELETVTDTTTYPIIFYLNKKDNKWELQDISKSDIEKLHGIYEG